MWEFLLKRKGLLQNIILECQAVEHLLYLTWFLSPAWKLWDHKVDDHAAGACVFAADAGGPCSGRGLRPFAPDEVHAANDEGTSWTPLQRGEGPVSW